MDWEELFAKVTVDKTELETMNKAYDRYIRLINDRLTKEDGDESNVIEDFVDTSNGIASLRNRPFYKEECRRIKDYYWKQIKKFLLEIITAQDNDKSEKFNALKKYIDEDIKVGSTPHAATLRLAASVLPNYLCSIAAEKDMDDLIKYLKKYNLISDTDVNGKDNFTKKPPTINVNNESI